MPKKRVVVYDFVRLIATILVVHGHSVYIIFNDHTFQIGSMPSAAQTLFAINQKIHAWEYSFHMPLFFILSGAICNMTYELRSFDTMCKKKAQRLLQPYLLTGLLFMIPIKYLVGFYESTNLPSIMSAFMSAQGEMAHLWFLPALFFCFIFFFFTERFVSYFNKTDSQFVVLFFACILSCIFSYKQIIIPYFNMHGGFLSLGWFALGYWFEQIRPNLNFCKNKAQTATIAILLAVICFFNLRYRFCSHIFTVILNSAFIFSISVFLSFWHKIYNSYLLKLLVSTTFYVYLFHDPLQYVIERISVNTQILEYSWGYFAYWLMRFFGTYIVSILIGVLCAFVCKKLVAYWRALVKPENVEYSLSMQDS